MLLYAEALSVRYLPSPSWRGADEGTIYTTPRGGHPPRRITTQQPHETGGWALPSSRTDWRRAPSLRRHRQGGATEARGAFFTPEPFARYIADWAVRSPSGRLLEPSCGEAAFLLAAVDRLAALLDPTDADPTLGSLDGVELHEASAQAARDLLRSAGDEPNITVGDFFTVTPEPLYDAGIGNPPYVRYQDLAGDARTRSRAAALRAGVPLTGLASYWAAFTVHSALFLKPGGRVGLVVPAELLTVNYAAAVRRFLPHADEPLGALGSLSLGVRDGERGLDRPLGRPDRLPCDVEGSQYLAHHP